jgi:multidrug efflux system outer membrane protein
MKNKCQYIFYTLVSVLLMTSCVPSQTAYKNNFSTIPEAYISKSDTASAATLSWREYFSDQNLLNLIDTALANNFDALTALQRIEAAQAGVIYSKGELLPTVGVGARAALWRYGLYTQEGSGNSTTPIYDGKIIPTNLPDFLIGFQSAWEADITGKIRNRKRAAIARYLSSVEGRHWVITSVVAEVASTYYELQALDNQLEMIRESIAIQENALAVVIIQKQTGMANELAVKQFQAQLLNTKSMEAEIEQQIIESENRINFLLGRYPQPINRDKTLFTQSIPLQIKSGVPSDLLRNRPDIKQAEFELVAAKADVRAAKAAFYPSLNITGSVGFQAFKTSLLFTTPESFAFTLVGGLSAPLLNRSAIKANFKGATAFQVEALYNYQRSILNGYVEVYNELNNIENLQKIFTLRNEEVTVLSQSIETSNELFRTGRATYLEVLLTQQNALNARLNFIDVRKRQLLSNVNIYKALGGGWR